METKHVKIFLASSSELKEDRVAFELELGRRNHSWIKKGLYLELVVWEDFIDAMSQERLQSEYNKAIVQCELFVMLFFTKVGKYTGEEFEVAFKSFKETHRPKIYTYFKDAAISTGSINRANLLSLTDFQQKLDDLGHFYTRYQNTEGLLFHFFKQLDKLIDTGFFGTPQSTSPRSTPKPVQTTEAAKNANSPSNETPINKDSIEEKAKPTKGLSDTERSGLENQKALIEEKVAYFKEEMLIASSPDVKFSLRKKVQELEKNLAEVLAKLNS